jgi:hypothetical protein
MQLIEGQNLAAQVEELRREAPAGASRTTHDPASAPTGDLPRPSADTRKLESVEAFRRLTADTAEPGARGREIPLRAFADQRRKYLLD